MFKITLTYNAGMNNQDIYTKEEETCSKDWLLKKKERMLNRWLKIITDGLDLITNEDERLYAKIYVIQNIINRMNHSDHKQRYFDIVTTEIKNDDENL